MCRVVSLAPAKICCGNGSTGRDYGRCCATAYLRCWIGSAVWNCRRRSRLGSALTIDTPLGVDEMVLTLWVPLFDRCLFGCRMCQNKNRRNIKCVPAVSSGAMAGLVETNYSSPEPLFGVDAG